MTDRKNNRSNSPMDSESLWYTHRSSMYVSRSSGGNAHKAPITQIQTATQPTPYSAEVSILEAARLAREQLPPVTKPESHKFAVTDGSSLSGKGLLSDMVQRPRILVPPSLPRQQYRQPVIVAPPKKKLFRKGTLLTGIACLVLVGGIGTLFVVPKHADKQHIQVLGVNTGL